ncbi:fimbria/pilus periplasmic chaperone [Kluyvera genomosp. 1]|uniref:fimbria/pilus periplasmic chaperone n=1 Tax=Kluyvera genomosp. 1 TaxID=2774053 RepID=UPI00068AE9B5|nr:fimbria/pilus periplasmic chaperone [Kluyvera genomosp. 1]
MNLLKLALIPVISGLYINSAAASVTIGGTRIIYDGSKNETSLSVENKDKVSNLVQSWITPADASTPGKEAIIVTPPLFRLDVGDKNALRIVRSGLPMPEDRESMYWLNVKGIPSTGDIQPGNSVQIAVNSRIKLIYRPKSLSGTSPEQFTQNIKWSISAGSLIVNNPTNYYMNFAVVKINGQVIDNATWVSPKSTASFKLASGITGGKISWRLYNDFGMAGKEHTASI